MEGVYRLWSLYTEFLVTWCGLGLHAVPVTGTAVVSTGPERERSVTRRPSSCLLKLTSKFIRCVLNCVLDLPLPRTCFTKGIHGIFSRL
jgi:hypothetical protein